MHIRKHQPGRSSPNDQDTPNVSICFFLRAIDCLLFGICSNQRHVRSLSHFETLELSQCHLRLKPRIGRNLLLLESETWQIEKSVMLLTENKVKAKV